MVKVWDIFILLCVSFLLHPSIAQSLHLKLIHRDSIHSPIYPGNLTNTERLERLYNYSTTQKEFYETMLLQPNYSDDGIRPLVKPSLPIYIVEVVVGTRRWFQKEKSFHLILDSGSSLIWIQCEPCINCWSPKEKRFDPKKSSKSFVPVPCDHPLCDLTEVGWACIQNQCHYTVHYSQPATIKGILGSDTFVFPSDGRGMEKVEGLVFGCSNDIQGSINEPQEIVGILGINAEPQSLISQVKEKVGGAKFSYCLPSLEDAASHLRLGHDATLQGPNVKTIPFVPTPGWLNYYLPLVDISVGNERIKFDPNTFRPIRDEGIYLGGFVIDSGSATSSFMDSGQNGGPYQRVKDAFINYFNHYKLIKASNSIFEVCYNIQKKGGRQFSKYPTMTFHFDNGNDFVVHPQNLLMRVKDFFCVPIRRSNRGSIWGAYHQQGYKFSYDIDNKKLSYVPADCNRDA